MPARIEAPVVAMDEPILRGGHILVVDADESLARTVSAVLRHEGYAVTTVFTLSEAVALLRDSSFDLLLAELRPEDGAGENTLAHLRSLAPAALVIVLARFATFESALRALRAGAYDYLLKPVDVDELRLTVARGLEHRRLERELAARVRDLEAAHASERTFTARLQQQVDEATAELQRQVAALDGANHQLHLAQEEHDRFVAMVAHEMRGPLNPIINFAQLAKRPGLPRESLEHYADIIVENAFRLNRLIDDLQTATRLSTGHFTLRRQQEDVALAVETVVDTFRATIHNRRVTLDRPAGPLFAEVDRDRVEQAVRNLIDNAAKYSAEDGAIEVSVWGDGTSAHVRVRDYGAGIPETEMARIFEAFTRLEKRTEVAGSGLGLYITRGIVEAHGGNLTVSNGSGTERARGAIFTITLPLAAPRDEAPSE
ncbi:MAG TPA: hybrid sensor histidine kinase/response regulator [Ktedonobacterales bacterium]|nr:hybrid sensor histidine kinase/response regulator [Ktedonobacterales bacterium]